MSLFRQGYLNVLPTELKSLLFDYYFAWANELLQLSTNYQNILIREAAETEARLTATPIKYKSVTACNSVYFDILIFPCPSAKRLYFPFKVYISALRRFLEKHIQYNVFTFLTVDKLQPMKKSGKFSGLTNTMENNIGYASIGKLINDKEGINIILEEIAGEIGIYYNSTEEDHPLYELDELQGELLIYKLIKFYNDLVSITETSNNLKDEY